MHETNVIVSCLFSELTINCEDYKNLCYYAMPSILDIFESPIFQQESAPAQWVIDVRRYADTKLCQGWTGMGPPIAYSARSPDFTPFDFLCRAL